MQVTRQITNDITYVGVSDRRLSLFENIFPIPRGVSYNSYIINDEKTALTLQKGAQRQGCRLWSGAERPDLGALHDEHVPPRRG